MTAVILSCVASSASVARAQDVDPIEVSEVEEVEVETSSVQVVEPMTLEQLVCSYSWPCQQALAVMNCESHGNVLASDGGYNAGLFQIAIAYHSRRLRPGESLYQAEANIRIAHEIWTEQSWRPWPFCGRNFR